MMRLRCFVWCGGALAALALFSAFALAVDGLTDNIGQADVGIVLGNKVERTGLPSPRLRARLDRAVALYREGRFEWIIVSGGMGKEGFDEAAVMKNYLVARGIPKGYVLVDSKGLTTGDTARNAAVIMTQNGWDRPMVITQYFHISRTRMAFQKQGYSEVYSAHAHHFEWRDYYSIPREVVGYAVYMLRD